jgi:hypothetical protein
VVVWKFDAPAPTAGNTAVQVRVSDATPPANDRVAGATPLRLDLPVATTTINATDDYEVTSPCFTGTGHTTNTAAGPDVVYSFVAPTDGTYSFRAFDNGSATNTVLYVASALPASPPPQVIGGSCLAAANRVGVGGPAEEVSVPMTSGQTAFVVVDAATTVTGAQKFVVEQPVREAEPDDTPATPSPLSCGATGSIVPAGDTDFWSLGGPPPGSRVFAMADGAASNNTDYDLRATTATDTLEYDDSNLGFLHGSNAPVIAGTPTTGAASFLRVSQFTSGVAAEPYRLSTTIEPPIGSATPEAEPNETPAQASQSPINYLSGALGSAADSDVFQLAAPSRARVFIALDADPLRDNTPFDAKLTVLAANGDVLETVDDGASSSNTGSGAGTLTSIVPNSPAEATAFRTSAPGPYFVKVQPDGATVGDYLLSMSVDCGAGALSLSPESLVDATRDQPYSQTLTASGGTAPFAFALTNGALPAGLALGADGTITGTPTDIGASSFTVQATDSLGWTGQRDYTVTVVQPPVSGPPPTPPGASDQTPPETTITKDPPDESSKTRGKYKFKSSEANSTFECKLDKDKFKACTSPRKVKHLDDGKHKFKVRAVDPAGNVDPTPAKDKFKVVEKQPG